VSPATVAARYDGLAVFSTTMIRERERMGEEVTSWLRAHPDRIPVAATVRQSSGARFHFLSILVFWRLDRADADPNPERSARDPDTGAALSGSRVAQILRGEAALVQNVRGGCSTEHKRSDLAPAANRPDPLPRAHELRTRRTGIMSGHEPCSLGAMLGSRKKGNIMSAQNRLGSMPSKVILSFVGAPLVFALGCATSGTEPHAMTAGQHEAAAKSEEQAAAEHGRCPAGYGGKACAAGWSSYENLAKYHIAEAERHRETGERHRAASQALRAAEARACVDVPDADRDISPFFHTQDMIATGLVHSNKGPYGQQSGEDGASVTFKALPGMTAEWLQRVVDCHLARNAVVGDSDGVMSYFPLAVPHVSAQVRSVGNGFEVDVTSTDKTSVKEIIARVRALRGNAPAASIARPATQQERS